MNWLFYTLIAMFLYGFVNFMYKVAASSNCPSHIILNKSALIVSILSLFGFILSENKFDNYFWIIIFALINSTFFAMGIIAKMISLKKASSSIVFPITKLNSVFLIIFAIFIFKESPLLNQWLGIILSFSMLFYISFNLSEEKDNKKTYTKEGQKWGIFYAILAALSTSVSMLVGKLASTRVPLMSYMLLSYSLVYINTLWINKFFIKAKFKSKEEKNKTTKFGTITGVLNFSGYYMSLKAVSLGPLSLIQGITSNVFIIPVFLSIVFYKEKLTQKKIIILLISIASIYLINS